MVKSGLLARVSAFLFIGLVMYVVVHFIVKFW